MSRNTLNKLTDRQCKAAKPRDKTYKLSDGGGLYLEVSQTGSKYWRMKYRRPSDNEPEIGALSKKVEREQNWRGKDTALKMIAGMAIALFESSKDFHSGGNLSINRVSAQVIENNIIFGNDEDSDTHPDTFRRLLTNALDKYAPKFKNKATKKRPK